MTYLNNNQTSASLPDVSSSNEAEIDIDLKGIPSFILDLQQIQPTLNIMTCGDVSHGKSTLLAALSGEKTGKHTDEKKGNMTIRLGYTSCKIWKCLFCPHPDCYFSTHSDCALKKVQCPNCGTKPNKSHTKYLAGDSKVFLIRHLSFVDVPGHAQLMQTMVSATSVADGAILVIDASKPVPGKQTAQHLDAMNLLGLMQANKMLIAQNKIDLISPSKACANFEGIWQYLRTFGDDAFAFDTPIIPLSAQSKLNIDALCNSIIAHLPKFSARLVAKHSLRSRELYMNVIRSFDVNRPTDLIDAAAIDRIAGGIIGGAVLNGHIGIGQIIEIRPGYLLRKKVKKLKNATDHKLQCQWSAQPIRTVVKSLKYGKNAALKGHPGGNVGVQTNIDPSLTKADRMCGHIVIDAMPPNPPPVFNKCVVSYSFLCDSGVRAKSFKEFEVIRVNIGSFKMKAEVIRYLKEYDGAVLLVLEAPICARIGDKVGICRQNKKKEWAFVGGGVIRSAKVMRIAYDAERQKALKVHAPAAMTAVTRTSSERRVHVRYQQRSGRKGVTTV